MRSLRNDLTGKKFGHLTVLNLAGRDKGGRALWECECDCKDKNHIVADGYNVRSGHTSSCGCAQLKAGYPKDLTGQKFSRLTVLGKDMSRRIKTHWMCECNCEKHNITSVSRCSLTAGDTTSCGCYHSGVTGLIAKTHGLSKTRIYGIWIGMKNRCKDESRVDYNIYGGRGISVCDEWNAPTSFESFYKWSINNGYKENLTIDRIDVNGNYTPKNCRWVDMKQQCNNTRKNIIIKYKDRVQTLAQWANELGMNYSMAYARIHRSKWSIEKAFEKPSQAGL